MWTSILICLSVYLGVSYFVGQFFTDSYSSFTETLIIGIKKLTTILVAGACLIGGGMLFATHLINILQHF